MVGLVAVMLLLGFGLVHIPRSMLREADPGQRLRHAYHKCAALPHPTPLATPQLQHSCTSCICLTMPARQFGSMRAEAAALA
jgi:hypothetical protein